MAIVQISKIQHRFGNIVDLPQLDEAEFGFASDAKRLFIGKVSPNENIEVLTSYSNIAFNQLEGSSGNLDITAVSLEDGQILAFDGVNWTNRGGIAGGKITLGDVGNVKISGGAIGYILETDGTGNLSWTPKSTIVAYVQNVSNANPAVVTTTSDNFFTDGAEITFTNLPGITGSAGYVLNGNSLYANVLTSNTFALYTDAGLTTPYDASGDTSFPYSSVTATSAANNRVTVGSSAPFSLNDPIMFIGSVFGVLDPEITYYVKSKPTGTTITLSLTPGGSTLTLTTDSGSCNVYAVGGRAIATVGGASSTLIAAGANTTVQFNNSGTLSGSSDFTWNTAASTNVLTVNGNANVGNLNATTSVIASTLTSNISTGSPPLTVSSTTRVNNLNVDYANVSDFTVVTSQSTGTYYPVFVSSNATGNRALAANANIAFNVSTGNFSVTSVYANSTITAVGNVRGSNLDTAGNVTASILISNVSTGTAPLAVTSSTRVANLNVDYANVADFINVADVLTGIYYPVLANAASGNVSEGSNANLTFNAATGALNSTLLGGTLTTAAQPNVTSVGTLTSLVVSGTITANDIATYGTAGDDLNISGAGNTNANGPAGNINIVSADGNGTGAGGNLTLYSGNANSSGNAIGGYLSLIAGTGYGSGSGGRLGIYAGNAGATNGGFGGSLQMFGGAASGQGGNIFLLAGSAAGLDHIGGDLTLKAGASTGAAVAGKIVLQTSTPGSTGNTLQTLANRVVISDTVMNVSMTTAASSTSTGAITVAGGLGVTGNVYAGFFYGAGNGLSNVQATSISGTVASATTATTAGTVTTAAQPNITSTGTLTGLTVASGSLNTTSPILVTQTWNNANVSFTGIRENITDTASASTSYLMDLQVGGTSQYAVYKNGNLVVGPNGNGSIQVTTLTTGANTTAGSITGNWSLTAGSRLSATYADLAENYEADAEYAPGTVLEFGGEKEVTLATDSTTRVAGVVSTDPAYLMNSSCKGIAVAIALQGRVPVKVRGKIRKGDLMISGGDGYARPSSNPLMGSVIGKALENFEGTSGVIEVAIGRL